LQSEARKGEKERQRRKVDRDGVNTEVKGRRRAGRGKGEKKTEE
jgi:hypothetical protein